jgi:CRP-like cAMP-binding protein
LLSGEVEITHNPGPKEWSSLLGPVSIFGESALLDSSVQSMQVVTKTATRILELPVSKIREVAQEAHTIRHLEDFRNAILVNQFFASSPVFRSLSTSATEFLSSRGALCYYDQGQTVFRQGDTGDSLFLVLRGGVDIWVHDIHVSALDQGQFFGEIALIANIPRTATVSVNVPTVLFRISADAFWEVLVQNLDLGVFIETISENRLRQDLEMASGLKATGTDS